MFKKSAPVSLLLLWPLAGPSQALTAYNVDPNAAFKSAGMPGDVIATCRDFEAHARTYWFKEPTAIDGRGVTIQWGGDEYECYVAKDPGRPLEIKKVQP